MNTKPLSGRGIQPLSTMIFWSRWLQAPLYLGLIVAQAVYVYRFLIELWHLISHVTTTTEEQIMLTVLGLIDVVMIANLLIMVIVGGYETFVSRLRLEGHPDQPEWLSHVNAGILKVKLATALIGISSIHLLKTFIGLQFKTDAQQAHVAMQLTPFPQQSVLWQVVIHLTFIISALCLAWTDKISMSAAVVAKHAEEH
ncbi:MAG TPA: TIGR00645 family protein [Chthoniobacteraceae bacterium]|jgi:uncharacterized protein (TIGR00645 family)|nr:hypothetical protein [Chthoniobacter sp.]HEV7867272.1 TIGR00645 family protein [Chthoniobacteraceae bacterium]